MGGGGDLYRVRVTGGDPVQLAASGSPLQGFAWTRDGSEIVFASGQAGNTTIGRVPAAGGAIIPVAGGEGAMDLSLSGDRLVFSRLSFDTDIWHLTLSKGSVPAVLPVSSTRADEAPQFSPDGQKIAFHSQRTGLNAIWVSALNGSNELQVTGFDGVDARTPRWSPEGRRLAFTGLIRGDAEIYTVEAGGGQAKRLTVSSGEDSLPSWSPDGQWVYFGSVRSGRTEIWRVSPNGGDAVQVTRNGGDGPVSFAGGFIYYRKGHPGVTIFRSRENGADEEQVFERPVRWNNWVARERALYFLTARDGYAVLARFDFADRAVEEVAVSVNLNRTGGVEALALSPDESAVLYQRRSRFDFDLMMIEPFR